MSTHDIVLETLVLEMAWSDAANMVRWETEMDLPMATLWVQMLANDHPESVLAKSYQASRNLRWFGK